jgi:hypothetical protein
LVLLLSSTNLAWRISLCASVKSWISILNLLFTFLRESFFV